MQANNSDRPAKSRIVSASFVEHRLRVILTLYKGTFEYICAMISI